MNLVLPMPAGAPHKAAAPATSALASSCLLSFILSLPFPFLLSHAAHCLLTLLRSSPKAPAEPTGVLGCLHRPEDDYCVGSHGALALKPEEGCKSEEENPQTPQAATPDSGPAETSVASVFQTLQSRLSSLETTVSAWRHHSLSFPRPAEGEDSDQGAPGSFGDQEKAGSGQQEAARLIERNAWLRLALGSREDELVCTQASLQDAQAEKETLQRQVSF